MCFHHSSLAKRERGAQRCWLVARALSVHHPPILPVPNLWRSWGHPTKPVHHWRIASLPCKKAATEEAAAARTQPGDLSQPIIALRDGTSLVPPSPLAPWWEQYLLCVCQVNLAASHGLWRTEAIFMPSSRREVGNSIDAPQPGKLYSRFCGEAHFSAWSFWVLYIVHPDPLLRWQPVLCLHEKLRDFLC